MFARLATFSSTGDSNVFSQRPSSETCRAGVCNSHESLHTLLSVLPIETLGKEVAFSVLCQEFEVGYAKV